MKQSRITIPRLPVETNTTPYTYQSAFYLYFKNEYWMGFSYEYLSVKLYITGLFLSFCWETIAKEIEYIDFQSFSKGFRKNLWLCPRYSEISHLCTQIEVNDLLLCLLANFISRLVQSIISKIGTNRRRQRRKKQIKLGDCHHRSQKKSIAVSWNQIF